MKTLNVLALIFSFTALTAFAQDKKEFKNGKVTIKFENSKDSRQALKDGFDAKLVAQKIKQSKKDLEAKLGKEEVAKMSPVSFTYELVKEEKKEAPKQTKCDVSTDITLDDNLENQMVKLNQTIKDSYDTGSKGVLFIQWGYNRGIHSKSDITVKTDKGSYTIKDAVGADRPSEFNLRYLKPSNFTKPQYNIKLGYWFSKDSKFGIGGGTDHMKWVFDNTREYEIEGDYTGDLWVKGQKKSFEEVVAGKDASFLLLEHTDGYNYPYLEGLYREQLINTKRFGLNAVAGVGAGILFPKTRTRVADQENTASYRDLDNKFKVAGFGVHADLSLVLKYKQKNGISYFAKPTVRGVAGKINNALYFADEGSISQSTIYTFEPSVNFGMEIPLNVISNPTKKLAKRELRILQKMQKLDEQNSKDELSLEEMQRQADEKEKQS